VWDSARFTSIFLASSFSCSQALSTPAHTQVTQTVGQPRAKPNSSLIQKVDSVVEFRNSKSVFLAVAFFKSEFESLVRKQGFKFLAFCSTAFLFIGKVSVWFHRVAKISVKVFDFGFGQRWF
jgi:hypothetical protein